MKWIMAYSQDSLTSALLGFFNHSLKTAIHTEEVLMETGNLMWPDGGCRQAYICCDDCGDLVWETTEQARSQVWRGAGFNTAHCLVLH